MDDQEKRSGYSLSKAAGNSGRAVSEPWTFLEGFSWADSRQDAQASGVRRLNVFPLKRMFMTEFLGRSVAEKLEALQKYVQAKFGKTGPKQYIAIHEVPILVFPGLKIFVEDYSRIPLTIHSSYNYWGYHYNLPAGDIPNDQLNNFLDSSPSLLPLKAVKGFCPDEWRLCSQSDAQAIFKGGAPGGWGKAGTGPNGITIGGYSRPTSYYFINGDRTKHFDAKDHDQVADVYIADFPDDCSLLEFLLRNEWTPETAVNEPQWNTLKELYEQDMISIKQNSSEVLLIPTEKLDRAVESGSIILNDGKPLIRGSQELFEDAKKAILGCDNRRANISVYDPMQLEDPNRGSWELWDPPMDGTVMMAIPSPVYARDPRLDVQEGGVIGIDFGTKSTVVARQDDTDRSILVRIGQGAYEQAVGKDDYENPTAMQFVNLQRFLQAYQEQKGRPATLWEDLAVSHTAFSNWMNNNQSSLYFSFFGELKQWAGNQGRNIRLRDQTGTMELSLPPYLELQDGDFDPIEVYAYYIGLYINNMFTGQIYLEYLLSFPVTYSQEVRRKILESFRRGLAKSLPATVLDDPEYAEQFSVEQGAGEPAAYAVCALQEYGFRPMEGENIYYAIFDFGGGTTDFDFGVWRRATKEKSEKNYRYVVNHFGDGGDQYLGGENLLELLAYHVFCNNLDLLRQAGITFTLPPRQELFDGHEFVISDSQEAHTNMQQVVECLRPLWERQEGYASKYSDGILQVNLIKRDGRLETGVQLRMDPNDLEDILRQRIRDGVEKFFNALRTVFERELLESGDAKRIHIFLAGNASKSDILQEIFRERIDSFTEEIRQAYQKRGEDDQADQEYFELYPPLGTAGAKEIMRSRGCWTEADDEKESCGLGQARRPTGKTGVAFGLIQCRSGSKIKVLNEIRADAEIKFRYWLGDDEDDFFSPFLTRNTGYRRWIEYRNAEAKYFEFYYTTDPSAERPNVLPTEKAQKWRSKPIPASAINEDWSIYLRATGPDQLEYVIAESQEAADLEQYQYGPIPVVL